MNSPSRFTDHIYCIARLIIGLMFACHGGQTILGFPSGGDGMPDDALSWVGALIQLGGGFLIAFGLLTRPAAFFAAGEMAVAYFMVHASRNFFPILNKGELAVIYCWFFLFVLFYGPGRWSIEALLRKKIRFLSWTLELIGRLPFWIIDRQIPKILGVKFDELVVLFEDSWSSVQPKAIEVRESLSRSHNAVIRV